MAEKNNNDSLFQWNFNLEDSDSDFTDIDFSSKTETSDKDIEPIIFVRDETAKKRPEEKRQQVQTASSASQNARRSQSTASRPAARTASSKKPVRKKKNSGLALNWKLIGVIVAGILLVALIVVLLGHCGRKEDKAWTKVEADSKVKALMDRYFEAKKDGQANDMRAVLVEDAVVNASVLSIESSIYKDYVDIELQQYPGIKKDEYVICASYDTVLDLIDASVPTISWFYALPDSAKNLRLMVITNKDDGTEIFNYVSAASALLADTTIADVKTRNANAINSNPILAQYLKNIEEGNYYTVPEPTESQSPEGSTDTPSTDTPAESGTLMYVNVGSDYLNMRSTASKPSDNSNVVKKLPTGYCVTVLSIDEFGWAHIRDDVTVNPATNTQQDVSGREAYLDVRYITPNYNEIP